jgi:outer membrane protein OmpA-like peptidoglycan-associated protein
MAARPVPHSLAVLSLVLGFAVAAPALAQNYIGSGNVQVNIQALDQLGGARTASPATTQLPLIGSTGKAPKQTAAPRAVQPSDALLGETGQTGAIKLRRPGSSAARKASASAAPKAAAKAAPAAAPTPPAVASAPAAAPTSVPTAPAPGAPAPSTPAPAASAPVTPAPATPAPAPAPQAGAPTPVVPATPAPAPAPTATPAPSVAAAPPAAAPAPVPQAAPAPAAPQAAPPPAPAPQVAAAPTPPRPVPAPVPGPGGLVTLAFPGGQGDLPAADLAALDALAKQYATGEDRLQIRAYAASTVSDGGSGARRLSLTRALAVRQYLIDKGIRSTRIDVRALGAPTDGSAADRVEVAPVGR